MRAVDIIDVFGTWGTEPNSKTLPPELRCTLFVLRRTLENYAAKFWATLNPTKLCCTLRSYAASYWAELHLSMLHCILRARLFPAELCCTLLSLLYPTELCCTLLSYAASYWLMLHPVELRCTLLCYEAPYWATLHPAELHCTLLSYAASCGATLHLDELCWSLLSYAAAVPYWATLHPILLRSTLLGYTAPCWATLLHLTALYDAPFSTTLQPLGYVVPNWARLRCNQLNYATTSELCCPVIKLPFFIQFFECRNAGLYGIQSVRYRNLKTYRNRNQSGIRWPSPIPECSGTGLRWWMP